MNVLILLLFKNFTAYLHRKGFYFLFSLRSRSITWFFSWDIEYAQRWFVPLQSRCFKSHFVIHPLLSSHCHETSNEQLGAAVDQSHGDPLGVKKQYLCCCKSEVTGLFVTAASLSLNWLLQKESLRKRLALCPSQRHNLSRVQAGWRQGDYIATSHIAKVTETLHVEDLECPKHSATCSERGC